MRKSLNYKAEWEINPKEFSINHVLLKEERDHQYTIINEERILVSTIIKRIDLSDSKPEIILHKVNLYQKYFDEWMLDPDSDEKQRAVDIINYLMSDIQSKYKLLSDMKTTTPPSPATQQCSCDSTVLFISGCQCRAANP